MATQCKRRTIDFTVRKYTSDDPQLKLVPDGTSPDDLSQYLKHEKDKSCSLRCYMSLQGEDSPIGASSRSAAGKELAEDQTVCRYDWAFGITLIKNKELYWDWRDELPNDGAVAVHVVLHSQDRFGGPEPIPTGAFLSILQPSRNTKSLAEQMLPITKASAALAKGGAPVIPTLDLVASGLTFGSDLLASYTGNRKNWFLYQFLDDDTKCPVVEWRINKQVFYEYGPVIRGTLFLAFRHSPGSVPGSLRILLRPQIRYHPKDELKYIVPSSQLTAEQQVCLEVHVG